MKPFFLIFFLFLLSCGQNVSTSSKDANGKSSAKVTPNKQAQKSSKMDAQQAALPIAYDFIEGFWMELEDLSKLRSAKITKPFPQGQGGFLGYETRKEGNEFFIHGSQSMTKLFLDDNQYLSDPDGYDLKGWSFEFNTQGSLKTLLTKDPAGKLMQTLHYLPANDNPNRFKDNSNLYWPYTHYLLKGNFLTQTPDGTVSEATISSNLKVQGIDGVNSYSFTAFGNELVLTFIGVGFEKTHYMCRQVKDGFDLYVIDLPDRILKNPGNIFEHSIRAKELAWKFRKQY